MSQALAALVTDLEGAAAAAWREEEALRTRMAQEIAVLERRRAFAFRRSHLVKALGAAAARAEKSEDVAAAQRTSVRHELGWEIESEFHRAILDGLRPAGEAVANFARSEGDVAPSAILAELEAFEAWYLSTYGEAFYALFDREVPQVALVET